MSMVEMMLLLLMVDINGWNDVVDIDDRDAAVGIDDWVDVVDIDVKDGAVYIDVGDDAVDVAYRNEN